MKKGNLLTENVVFIVLNVVFILVLVVFLASKMDNSADMEERYAKQIALLVDAAKSGEVIEIDMADAVEEAEKNKIDNKDIVKINGNEVLVKLSDGNGYSYSFFTDAEVSVDVFPLGGGKNGVAKIIVQ